MCVCQVFQSVGMRYKISMLCGLAIENSPQCTSEIGSSRRAVCSMKHQLQELWNIDVDTCTLCVTRLGSHASIATVISLKGTEQLSQNVR